MTAPNPNTHAGFLEFMRVSEHRARCYVQGSAYHDKLKSVQPISGGWSQHFRSHPRVIEAEREGWSRDLRAAIVAECKHRLLHGQDLGEPDDLMPQRREWWEGARANAARYRAAMAANYEPQPARPEIKSALTSISKRMTGEA